MGIGFEVGGGCCRSGEPRKMPPSRHNDGNQKNARVFVMVRENVHGHGHSNSHGPVSSSISVRPPLDSQRDDLTRPLQVVLAVALFWIPVAWRWAESKRKAGGSSWVRSRIVAQELEQGSTSTAPYWHKLALVSKTYTHVLQVNMTEGAVGHHRHYVVPQDGGSTTTANAALRGDEAHEVSKNNMSIERCARPVMLGDYRGLPAERFGEYLSDVQSAVSHRCDYSASNRSKGTLMVQFRYLQEKFQTALPCCAEELRA